MTDLTAFGGQPDLSAVEPHARKKIADERAEALEAHALNDDSGDTNETPPAEKREERTEQKPAKVEQPPERNPNKRARDEIAKRHAEARAAAQTDPSEMPTREDGQAIPPFIAAQEEAARQEQPRDEQGRFASKEGEASEEQQGEGQPETFTLKVLGNEINVTFDELAKEAGLDPDEAKEIPQKALIRAAQMNAAARERLDQAKAEAKSARAAPRATGETTPDSSAIGTQQSNQQATQDQGPDLYRETVEAIQFGDPEEAKEKLAALVEAQAQKVVKNALTTEQFNAKRAAAANDVNSALRSFGEANKDIVGDPDNALVFENRYFVQAVRDAFTATGKVAKENADALIRTPTEALQALEEARADGRLQLPDPAEVFKNAATQFRAKRAAPANTQAGARATPALSERAELKRSLPSQPTRTAVPMGSPSKPVQRDGSSVVAAMRKARGQAA